MRHNLPPAERRTCGECRACKANRQIPFRGGSGAAPVFLECLAHPQATIRVLCDGRLAEYRVDAHDVLDTVKRLADLGARAYIVV